MLKKIAAVLALSGLIAGVAYAGINPQQGINGSAHDMNRYAAVGAQDDGMLRTCIFCHTPHNAKVDPLAPLWNRTDGTRVFTAYQWVAPANQALSLTATEILDPLVGPTRLCMSCHDGTIAPDTHGGAGPLTGGTLLTGPRLISDLTITHPIGFDYGLTATARGTSELVPAAGFFIDDTAANLMATTFNTNDRTGLNYSTKTLSSVMYGGMMTCSSCHEVHNTTNAIPEVATPTQYNYFLQAKEEGSAICLSCHIK